MLTTTIEMRGRPAALLLVEDNFGDVLLVQEAFRRAKIRNVITVAKNGEEAMRMLRREPPHQDCPRPDLILLDINLPRMNGRQVLQAVKSDPALQSIPVVMLTSSKADTDVIKSYRLSANGYIVKPLGFERLQEIVASLETFWFSVVVLAPSDTLETLDA
jgi:CheY-like chemotaxis protein